MAFTGYSYATGLAALGQGFDALDRTLEANDKRQLLGKLGQQVQSGDFSGAASTAFSAGDINAGSSLLKLGQTASAGNDPRWKAVTGEFGLGGKDAGSPIFIGPSKPVADNSAENASAQTVMRMPADPEIEAKFIDTAKAGGLTNPYGLGALTAYARAESGFSPNNVARTWSDPSQSGQPGTSGGILSWRGPRLAAMQAATRGADDPVAAQAKFALTENPDLTVALQNAKSPQEANALMANAWRFAGYDQPGGEFAKRLGMTKSYAGRFGTQEQPVQTADASAPTPQSTARSDPSLDAGLTYRITNGAKANPGLPVTQFVGPADIAANRDFFLDPGTGQPRTAGEIASVLSGGQTAPVAAATAPQTRGVQVASADPSFAPQMPPDAANKTPSQVLVDQAKARDAAKDPLVSVPGINGGKPINKAWVDAQPDGADVPDDGVLEAAQAKALGSAAPATAGSTMPTPQANPAAVSAAAPQVIAQAGLPQSLARSVASTEDPQRRVRMLTSALMIPGLDENRTKVLNTLLANELDQSKLPEPVKTYNFYAAQEKAAGRLPLSFVAFQDRNQKAESDTNDIKNYNYYANQEKAAGRTPLSFSEYDAASRNRAAGPKVVKPGEALVEGNKEVYRNQSTAASVSDDNADFLAERVLAGDTRALTGLGRGAQGAENLAKVQSLVAQKARERGIDASDLLHNSAIAQGMNAQERTFGTQTARMASASTEAEGAIELGRLASQNVPRTSFVPLNRAMQMVQSNTGDPKLRQFVAANNTIINTFARAINPNGTPTVSDKEHAREMLSTADSPEAYEAVLQQMQKEIDLAHQAPNRAQKMLEDQRQQRKSQQPGAQRPSPQSDTAPAPSQPQQQPPQSTSPSGVDMSKAKVSPIDNQTYVPDPGRPGKWLRVNPSAAPARSQSDGSVTIPGLS